MPLDDKSLNIHIRTTANTEGMEKTTRASKDLSNVTHLLARQFPGLAQAATALKGPLGSVAAVVTTAAIVIRHAIAQYRELLALNRQLLSDANGKSFASLEKENRDAMRASAVAAAAFEVSLRKLAEAKATLLQQQEREITSETDPQRLERQKRVAEAELALARQELERVGPAAFAAEKRAREAKSNKQGILDADTAARENLKANQARVDELLTSAGSGRAIAPDVRDKIMAAAGRGSVSGVIAAGLPAGVLSTGDANQLILLAAAMRGNRDTISATPKLLGTAERSQMIAETEAQLSGADFEAARSRAKNAAERAGSLGVQARFSRDSSIAGSMRVWKQNRVNTITTAAEGADAIRSGQAATEEQKQAIVAMAQALSMIGQNNAAIIKYLATLNDSQDQFSRALARLDKRAKFVSDTTP